MKTNKFENTIRRKLESIQPDFQEQDWAKMQQYMQVHTPPTFWQQYGSWIGYAAAASVSTVMAFLYVNQLSQNNALVADMKNLKSQIEVIQKQPAVTVKTDTIFVVQREPADGPYTIQETQPESRYTERITRRIESDRRAEANVAETNTESFKIEPSEINSGAFRSRVRTGPGLAAAPRPFTTQPTAEKGFSDSESASREKYLDPTNSSVGDISENQPNNPNTGISHTGNSLLRLLDDGFTQQISFKNGVSMNSSYASGRKMSYELANRLSTRQVQRSLNLTSTQWNSGDTKSAKAQFAKATVSDKKAEQVNKSENVIPKLPLKVPYRFGAGMNIEGNGQAKTVVAEVLLAKKFSITAGINWLKVKPMEFFNEKIFREKNRQDFKKTHPGEVPLAFNVYNINVAPTMVQIPLTVAFRNNIKDNWAYYAGVGTNITVSSKEKISFECKAPNNEYFAQTFDKKTDVAAINSINFSMGIEKTWYPIVVQAEGYLYNYFKPLSPLVNGAGPGVKVKVLYQIGGKM
jgi:hypothetical protein